jgi:hypothetical protein
MSADEDYPIAVFEDRYGGGYSGGAWIAIAEASEPFDEENTRAQFCLIGDAGPFGGDVAAGVFWNNPPEWIAVGPTPAVAIEALRNRRKSISARDT